MTGSPVIWLGRAARVDLPAAPGPTMTTRCMLPCCQAALAPLDQLGTVVLVMSLVIALIEVAGRQAAGAGAGVRAGQEGTS
jgi:hypothetical protein